MVHEALVLQILYRFLQCNDVLFSCDVFLNGTWFTTSGSQILAQNADPRLLQQTVWDTGVEKSI